MQHEKVYAAEKRSDFSDDDAANPRIPRTLRSNKNLLKTLSPVLENHSIVQSGAKYGDVLKLYFSSLCKPDAISRRPISNTKLVP